jgi:ribose transport system permease protein
MLTALAGMVLMGRLLSAQPNTERIRARRDSRGHPGRDEPHGGAGHDLGNPVGALIIGILNNGFNLMAVDAHFQLVAKGVIILLAVLLDRYLKRSGN